MFNLMTDAARVAPGDAPRCRAFFTEMLTASEGWNVIYAAMYGLVATAGATAEENAEAITALGAVLHDPVDAWFGDDHADAVCTAYALIPGAPNAPEWGAFVQNLTDATLTPAVRALVEDPSSCASGLPF